MQGPNCIDMVIIDPRNPLNPLTQSLCGLIDLIDDLGDDATKTSVTRRTNAAKREFESLRISNLDFHGFWDSYETWKSH